MAVVINGTTGVSGVDGSAGTPSYQGTDSNTGIFFPAADTIAFAEGGAEAMRITSSGNVLINTTSSIGISVVNPKLQVEFTDYDASFVIKRNQNDTGGPTGHFIKSRGTTNGSNTVVQSGDTLGQFRFWGTDGTDPAEGASITAQVDGTPGNNDMPGRLVFSTTADGSDSPTERMRIDSSGNVGIGTTPKTYSLGKAIEVGFNGCGINGASQTQTTLTSNAYYNSAWKYGGTGKASIMQLDAGACVWFTTDTSGSADGSITFAERMRITSGGSVLVGGSSSVGVVGSRIFEVQAGSSQTCYTLNYTPSYSYSGVYNAGDSQTYNFWKSGNNYLFGTVTNPDTSGWTERARITSDGNLLVGKTTTASATVGVRLDGPIGYCGITRADGAALGINRQNTDGDLVQFLQADAVEGSISVSGNTVSYNGFSGGHWTQLQEGRGYSPEILRGTVMSSIGEMCEWKSVIWTETIEHPAVPAVEAKEAVLDEEGNVVEPAVEAVEGKDAWTETFNKREAYLGNLAVGATFTEDGVTKTVVDDGNERLPKVKISDIVGDKAVYGVFQTYDEVQDMLVTSLGAFVVRIAAGVTVQIGDLLESNGDGCAKVQDDDVIRSKTIGKVTSTTPTATYDDGSYTVPCVIYCG